MNFSERSNPEANREGLLMQIEAWNKQKETIKAVMEYVDNQNSQETK